MGWDILCWGTGNRVGLSQAQSSAPSPVSAGASAAPLRGRAGRLQPWGTAQSGCHGLQGPWWQLGRAGTALPRDTEGKYQGLRPSAVAAGNLSPHILPFLPDPAGDTAVGQWHRHVLSSLCFCAKRGLQTQHCNAKALYWGKMRFKDLEEFFSLRAEN